MKDIKTKRAAIYARVSTDGQTTDNQLCELHLVAERNGWPIVQEFVDQGISGAKGRDQRPAFNALWKGAIRREFDVYGRWIGWDGPSRIWSISSPRSTRRRLTSSFTSRVSTPPHPPARRCSG